MQIVFLFYDQMTALDAIGPHEILCRIPNATIIRAAKQAGSILTESAGLVLQAEYSLADISHADVLVVPGGGHAPSLQEYPDILQWINAIHKTTTWTTSVCTGSLILGAAGLLNNIHATSHWAAIDRLKKWGALPVTNRVVEDGKIITSAGVSAGIDMALILTAKIAGQAVADQIQLGIEYDPAPRFDVGSVDKAPPETVTLLRNHFAEVFEKC